MTTRRSVLKAAATFTIGGVFPKIKGFEAVAQSPRPVADIQIGAQTNAWAIDPKNFDSLLAVLGQVKQVGYAGFETGFFNLLAEFDTPDVARQKIADTGLAF